MYRGGVDAHYRRHLKHDVLRAVNFFEVRDVRHQHIFDKRGIREVHRGADASDEDVRDEGAIVLLLDRPVDRGAGDAPQNGDLRPDGLRDDDDERQRHGDRDAEQDAEEECAHEGGDPKDEVLLLDAPQLDRLLIRHQRDDRADHDCREHEVRHVVEQGRQEEQGAHHDDRGGQTRELRLGACGVAHGRPGEAACDGVAREHRPHEVGNAEGEELLPRVDVVVVLRGEVLADGDGLHVADQACGQGCGKDLSHGLQAPPLRADRPALLEHAGDVADIVDVVLLSERRHHAHQYGPDEATHQRA
mmetsp:Transcript_102840/g.297335  ORF Transcript_102840/g.297335 Transcript_102840/m.297335 type:complete len:303 (-) Transcript_102840:1050-1958(-)